MCSSDLTSGAVTAAGVAGLRAEPDLLGEAGPAFRAHSLGKHLLAEGLRHLPVRLKQLIKAVGGALPVTASRVGSAPEGAGQVLFFTFKHQTWNPAVNYAVPAVILATVPGGSVILQAAGTLLAVEPDLIVAGAGRLPADIQHMILGILGNRRTIVWLRVGTVGELTGGLGKTEPESDIELLFTASSATESAWGVVCRAVHSRRLLWAPSSQLGWTEPDWKSNTSWLLSCRRRMRGLLLENGFVSFTATKAADP